MIGRSGGMILHLALDGVGAARSSPAPARAKCFVWCLGAHSLSVRSRFETARSG
jgi:hypothetical protein